MSRSLTNNQLLIRELVTQEFSDSSYSDEATFFEFFATSQALKDYDLSDEEIESGLIGSGLDGGCDSIYLFYNDVLVSEDTVENISISREAKLELTVIQAKNSLSFGEDAIMKWKTTMDNLLQFDNQLTMFQGRYSNELISFFQLFKDFRIKLLKSRLKLSFRFFYITLSNELHPNVEAQANELKDKIYSMFPGNNTLCEVKFVSADSLMSCYNTQSDNTFNLSLSESPIAMGRHKDYVALVSLSNYYKFITDEKNELRKYIFESNVRDYQGHNNVNNEIHETLSCEHCEDFWWLNNGVTIVCSDATLVTGKELLLTDPEIVNGLQTSNEIYNYFKDNSAALEQENRNLLVRVIVPENESSRDKIILATNSQTSIPPVALRATDPIHRQIEMYFKSRGLYYDRRKNYYKNQGKKTSEIVSIAFLGQCLMSLFLQKPNFARARPSTLLNNDEYYKRMYIDNNDLEVFYKSALLGKRIEKSIKTSDKYSTTTKSDILFYVLFYVVASYLGTPEITPTQLKSIDLIAIDDSKIHDAAQVVLHYYNILGANSTVAKGSDLILQLKSSLDKKVVENIVK